MKARQSEYNGLLLLNKNPGQTSFESLNFIKKTLSTGKVGHTGTLDKFASGLLLVLVGKVLKLNSLFTYCKKVYKGRIHFGKETDTLDPEGAVIAEAQIPSHEAVESALEQFRGEIMQAPPAYSAIHIDGKRAHELSRQGIQPEMKKRPVTIYNLELVSWEPPYADIHVTCSSGTYIRSLARDIALAAGSRGYLYALERTNIGNFALADAYGNVNTNANTSELDEKEQLEKFIKPVNPELFSLLELPFIYADEDQLVLLKHGQSLEGINLRKMTDTIPDAFAAGIFSKEDKLAAVLEPRNGKWQYGHVFL